MNLFRLLYAPLFFFMFVGAALVLLNFSWPVWILIALLVGAIGVSFIAERIARYEPEWNRGGRDFRRDLAHVIVNEGMIVGLVLLLPFFASLVPWSSIWPTGLPFWAQLILAIVLLDCGITLAHYASHRNAMLWRFHAVHHSVQRLYGMNGLLKHPMHQLVEISAGTLPWLVLGIPQSVAIAGSFAVAIQLLLQHSNVDMRLGPLAKLWAVGPVHRQHHLASATEGDVNFGLFLTIWDILLGTARFHISVPVKAGMVGIAGRSDYPASYTGQIAEPFRETLNMYRSTADGTTKVRD